eukprot:705708-Rhodomonas_salina.1
MMMTCWWRKAVKAGDVDAMYPLPSLLLPAPRRQIQETAIAVQFVPGMRFLVPDFGVLLLLLRPYSMPSLASICSAPTPI